MEPAEVSRAVFLQWFVDHLRGVRRKLLNETLRALPRPSPLRPLAEGEYVIDCRYSSERART